jgi:predicted pyridoxine 5'-phosphate oxidase superfamily flavin-nucleotide-binding protein
MGQFLPASPVEPVATVDRVPGSLGAPSAACWKRWPAFTM